LFNKLTLPNPTVIFLYRSNDSSESDSYEDSSESDSYEDSSESDSSEDSSESDSYEDSEYGHKRTAKRVKVSSATSTSTKGSEPKRSVNVLSSINQHCSLTHYS
jgi:hypothetical protein